MKTKKQKKITLVQVKALEKKLIVLQNKRQRMVAQTTPLKIILRKFIQQNMEAVLRYAAGDGPGSADLNWAADKVKRGYFGIDTNLEQLVRIAHILNAVRWEE